MDKFAVKKKNYNIFSGRLVSQKSLSTNLKEHRINRALNETLAKMDLVCSNNLDENFIKNDIVTYLTLWLLNHMTPNCVNQ